ncbi:hypothetical protein PR048_017569 [Dryococelus australis]|uniref:Uncharacterized protein n=1 Tax=Dryococelus australis TaxID=614101 RepID=A0ABQ9HA23_9NEOP|nr:hypothetical protein PR048_017569 [Dryococelus australis]
MAQRRNAWRGKREIPGKTSQTAASFGMIPTCKNLGANLPGIEQGSLRCGSAGKIIEIQTPSPPPSQDPLKPPITPSLPSSGQTNGISLKIFQTCEVSTEVQPHSIGYRLFTWQWWWVVVVVGSIVVVVHSSSGGAAVSAVGCSGGSSVVAVVAVVVVVASVVVAVVAVVVVAAVVVAWWWQQYSVVAVVVGSSGSGGGSKWWCAVIVAVVVVVVMAAVVVAVVVVVVAVAAVVVAVVVVVVVLVAVATVVLEIETVVLILTFRSFSLIYERGLNNFLGLAEFTPAHDETLYKGFNSPLHIRRGNRLTCRGKVGDLLPTESCPVMSPALRNRKHLVTSGHRATTCLEYIEKVDQGKCNFHIELAARTIVGSRGSWHILLTATPESRLKRLPGRTHPAQCRAFNSRLGRTGGVKRDKYKAAPECMVRGEGEEILEKIHRPVALSGTIPTCENTGAIPPSPSMKFLVTPLELRRQRSDDKGQSDTQHSVFRNDQGGHNDGNVSEGAAAPAAKSIPGRVPPRERRLPTLSAGQRSQLLANCPPARRPARTNGPGPVVRRRRALACSRANRRGRSLPDFRMWESCRTMPLVGGFSRGFPVSTALLIRRYSILTSFQPHRLSRARRLEPPVSLHSTLFFHYVVRLKNTSILQIHTRTNLQKEQHHHKTDTTIKHTRHLAESTTTVGPSVSGEDGGDDNARGHVSRATMQRYADNNVRRLDWPTQSPDLNPI